MFSIGGRNITNLWFTDDIDALVSEKHYLETIVESLGKIYTRCKMVNSVDKIQLVRNSVYGIQREIKMEICL